MDKVTQYQQLILNILNEQPALIYQTPDELVETHAIYDEAHKRYMLFRVGWLDKERVSSALIYVRLRDGKIWIEEDWTENGIAGELVAAGVPKEDIVLGFRHALIRPLSEFAVA